VAYAENTTVDSAKSRAEIEKTLERYGADQFGYATMAGKAAIEFVKDNRRIRLIVMLPDKQAPEFILTPSRKFKRTEGEALVAWEKATRQKWRALALVVKAKLEAVDAGITTFEEEFLAHIVLPNGETVWENTHHGIELAYESGKVPPMLTM
jgi:hypothetical protein